MYVYIIISILHKEIKKKHTKYHIKHQILQIKDVLVILYRQNQRLTQCQKRLLTPWVFILDLFLIVHNFLFCNLKSISFNIVCFYYHILILNNRSLTQTTPSDAHITASSIVFHENVIIVIISAVAVFCVTILIGGIMLRRRIQRTCRMCIKGK